MPQSLGAKKEYVKIQKMLEKKNVVSKMGCLGQPPSRDTRSKSVSVPRWEKVLFSRFLLVDVNFSRLGNGVSIQSFRNGSLLEIRKIIPKNREIPHQAAF